MIRVYNTQSRSKQEFTSVHHGEIRMYVCGPTVYNYIHIGNARTFICFDMIRRYLSWRGFKVAFVQNVTDVDDKIIAKANEEGRTAAEVAEEYTRAFIDDMHAVGVLDPDIRPKATEEIPDMIDLVQTLIDKGYAYEAEGDVYFDVRSFPEYGSLSHRDVDEMESGHRDLRAADAGIGGRKRDILDFAVWKAAKPGEPSWDSPWGEGRPGWHIECSAMSRKYLGLPFDIHGGGADLVFPHHENEIAQAEAAWGEGFANYWLHSGMLQIDSEKMSKSLGNFLLLRDVLKTTEPEVLRMLMLQTHYRSPLDFSAERLEEASAALERITSLTRRLQWAIDNAEDIPSPLDIRKILGLMKSARNEFIFAMDDDFNTAGALGQVFTLVSELNAQLGDATCSISDVPILRDARAEIVELLGVFGIDLEGAGQAEDYPQEVVALAKELTGYPGENAQKAVAMLLDCRQAARKQRDFALADKVRDGLGDLGFAIEDTPQGARVTYQKK
ncbi:cysteine--tRNA ligase [Curtanaerobium respiraculi]|uniref:cysteine--tRNA ligase n=1 Tax=Curtanaerobium respiraculi TaxID=2949669 RepID=UPI0024B37540|nr:cysteine--tRNA ligase [Curtanaerobium respiraculi]